MQIVDTHLHIWSHDLDWYPWLDWAPKSLQRDFTSEQLDSVLAENGIGAGILVQAAETEDEVAFLIDEAAKYSWAKGIVGRVDFFKPGLEDRLRDYKARSPFVGIRVNLDLPDVEAHMMCSDGDQTLEALSKNGMTLEILTSTGGLERLQRLQNRAPDLTFVIDHAASPHAWEGGLEDWSRKIKSVASHEHTFCKFSGLGTGDVENTWRYAEPVLETLLETFGPERILWSSNWPVETLSGAYSDWITLCKKLIPLDHADAIFGTNALRAYGLCELSNRKKL